MVSWLTSHIPPEIHLENLGVGYGDFSVLSNINSILPAGKISVILGGSGGGKSTLLKSILGLLEPTNGDIWLGGVNLYKESDVKLREIRKRMGVLFQDGALLGSLPLSENIALPLREHTSLDEVLIETIVKMKLTLVGLGDFMDFFPNQLSGGMRKRAGLARALVLDPQILLCDEPTSGLDPITAADLDNLIIKLNETFNMSIIVVSHDLNSVFNIADNVLVLNKGTLVFQGTKEQLQMSTDGFINNFLKRKPSHN